MSLYNLFYDRTYNTNKKKEVPVNKELRADGVPYRVLKNMGNIVNGNYLNSEDTLINKTLSVKNWAVAGLVLGFVYAIVYKKNTIISGTFGAAALGTLGFILKQNK